MVLAKSVFSVLVLCLLACSHRGVLAPVVEISPSSLVGHAPGVYVVQPGDTLYSIAWAHEWDYRQLAQVNHIVEPYTLGVGQQIMLDPQQKPSSPPPVSLLPNTMEWQWPTQGNVIAHYAPAQGNKGIQIAGMKGQPVTAAASGRVAYTGGGLRNYGNLVLIKHDNDFLSAYAHNEDVLVKEGDEVLAGQQIASMGNDGRNVSKLHFEIRQGGKSVDPFTYIPLPLG